MKCKLCGSENPEFSRECSFCGAELQTEAELENKRKMRYKGDPHTQPGPGNRPEEKPQTQSGTQSGPEAAPVHPDPPTSPEEAQNQSGQMTIPDDPSHEQVTDKKPSQNNKHGAFTAKGGTDKGKKNDGGEDENKKKRMLILICATAVLLAVIVLISSLIRKQKPEPAATSDPYSDDSTYEETPAGEEASASDEGGQENPYAQEAEPQGDQSATGVLLGTISDRETGNPISDARVIFYDDAQNEFPLDGILTTGSDGSFSIELPEGTYSVQVIKNGYLDYITERIYRVDRGETTVISRIEIPAEKTAEQPQNNENSNDSEYLLPFSNERYLTDADLDPLSEWELKLARNEIYARHGRRFKDPDLQSYFDSKSWYRGRYDPDDFDKNHSSDLSTLEKKNAEYILKYEKDHNYFT